MLTVIFTAVAVHQSFCWQGGGPLYRVLTLASTPSVQCPGTGSWSPETCVNLFSLDLTAHYEIRAISQWAVESFLADTFPGNLLSSWPNWSLQRMCMKGVTEMSKLLVRFPYESVRNPTSIGIRYFRRWHAKLSNSLVGAKHKNLGSTLHQSPFIQFPMVA